MPIIRNENLVRIITGKSNEILWDEAKLNWEFDGIHIPEKDEKCICESDEYKYYQYLYTLKHTKDTNIKIYPICQRCLDHINNPKLLKTANDMRLLHGLYTLFANNQPATFDNGYFTDDIFDYMYKNIKIQPTQYNKHSPINDWKFIREMILITKTPSMAQLKKAEVLMNIYIRPFVTNTMAQITKKPHPQDVIQHRIKYKSVWMLSPILTKNPNASNANFFTTSCPMNNDGLCSVCPNFRGVYPDNKRIFNTQTEYEGFCNNNQLKS